MASKEAPGDLALVRAFVNSLDLDDGVDHLALVDGCTAWLVEHGLPAEGIDAGVCARLAEVREALRELLLANNDGHPPDPGALDALRRAAERAPLSLQVDQDGKMALRPVATGPGEALGRLLAITYEAVASGQWSRLKVCRNDSCRWAFYDNSRNHSAHWCSMAVCGNRSKVQGYRQRKAGAQALSD